MTKLVWGCTSPPIWLLAIESEPEMASVEVRTRLSLEELFRGVGLSAEAQQRFDELTAKRRAEALTPEEHRELLASIERIERTDAERAQALIALAQLRKVSVEGLMAELGIRLPTGG